MRKRSGPLLVFMLLAMPYATAEMSVAADHDEQALRIRDAIADPSVPLAWDRRAHPETWRSTQDERAPVRCTRRHLRNAKACGLSRH